MERVLKEQITTVFDELHKRYIRQRFLKKGDEFLISLEVDIPTIGYIIGMYVPSDNWELDIKDSGKVNVDTLTEEHKQQLSDYLESLIETGRKIFDLWQPYNETNEQGESLVEGTRVLVTGDTPRSTFITIGYKFREGIFTNYELYSNNILTHLKSHGYSGTFASKDPSTIVVEWVKDGSKEEVKKPKTGGSRGILGKVIDMFQNFARH